MGGVIWCYPFWFRVQAWDGDSARGLVRALVSRRRLRSGKSSKGNEITPLPFARKMVLPVKRKQLERVWICPVCQSDAHNRIGASRRRCG
jgi:hypothetical protein